MRSLHFCFVDDTEFQGARNGRVDSFIMAAYVCSQSQLEILKERLEGLKEQHHIPARVPVKWNFKDEKVVAACARAGRDLHARILAASEEIRFGVLSILEYVGVTAVLSCRIWSGTKPDASSCYKWAFCNLLQRIAFWPVENPGAYPNLIVIADRRKEESVFGEYAEAYWLGRTLDGQSYHAGPLRRSRSMETLLMGAGTESPHLQMADVLAGAGKAMLAYLLNERNRTVGPRLVQIFSHLLKRHNGRCVGYGLVVYPLASTDLRRVEDALRLPEGAIR